MSREFLMNTSRPAPKLTGASARASSYQNQAAVIVITWTLYSGSGPHPTEYSAPSLCGSSSIRSRTGSGLFLTTGLEMSGWLPQVFPGLRIILLQRRDKVRGAISYWRAATSGIWAVDLRGKPAWRSPAEPLKPEFDVQVINELHSRAHAGTPMPPPRLARQADGQTGRYVTAWQSATGGCPSCGHAASSYE